VERRKEEFCVFKHEGASLLRVFVKRDGASGGGDGGGDGGGGGDGDGGNDRQQLKGGESESRTSSTRQPHASSPPGPSPSGPGPADTYTWDSWQAGETRGPRDRLLERACSLRGIDESRVRGIARRRY